MDSFKTYLEEGRDAPLYHSLHYRYLISGFIKQDKIMATWPDPDYIVGRKYRDKDTISLTRNIRMALQWSRAHKGDGPILELDQRKLTQKHKVIPYNWMPYKTRGSASELDIRGDHPSNQYEETVFGTIKNASKYVTKIIVLDNKYKNYDELENHPLIWDYKTRKFVNQ